MTRSGSYATLKKKLIMIILYYNFKFLFVFPFFSFFLKFETNLITFFFTLLSFNFPWWRPSKTRREQIYMPARGIGNRGIEEQKREATSPLDQVLTHNPKSVYLVFLYKISCIKSLVLVPPPLVNLLFLVNLTAA